MLIVNGTLGDKSFFDSAANGMKMIKDKYGDEVETRILEIGDDPTKWEPVLLDASEQDWDLIIAGTYQMAETVGSVAQQYPDKNTSFMMQACLMKKVATTMSIPSSTSRTKGPILAACWPLRC